MSGYTILSWKFEQKLAEEDFQFKIFNDSRKIINENLMENGTCLGKGATQNFRSSNFIFLLGTNI